MGIYKAGNPAFNEKTFEQAIVLDGQEVMTINGTMRKFGLMLVMLIGAASFTWGLYYKDYDVMPIAIGAAIAGFIVALVIIFKKTWAPYLALAYSLLQGLFLGAISAVFDEIFKVNYPGIVLQAVMLTFGVAASMYALYYFRIVQATPTFKKVAIGATMAIALFYVVAMVMNMFGAQMPYLHSNGMIGIGISLFVIIIAAPKYYEWYSAFGLMVTIVWLYLEILRLLSKLASRK